MFIMFHKIILNSILINNFFIINWSMCNTTVKMLKNEGGKLFLKKKLKQISFFFLNTVFIVSTNLEFVGK